jgi:hypothetical protein
MAAIRRLAIREAAGVFKVDKAGTKTVLHSFSPQMEGLGGLV